MSRVEELHAVPVADSTVVYSGISHGAENEMFPASLPLPASLPSPTNVMSSRTGMDIPSDSLGLGDLESEIPGLDSSAHNDGCSETVGTLSLASTDLEDASQEQVTSLDGSSTLDLHPAVSTDRSDELSPKAAVAESNCLISSTATTVGLPCTFVLPKMSAPVVDLAEEQKDELQNLAFMHIVEAYKQIAVAGGSQVRFSLLAYLGVEVLILPFKDVSYLCTAICNVYNIAYTW